MCGPKVWNFVDFSHLKCICIIKKHHFWCIKITCNPVAATAAEIMYGTISDHNIFITSNIIVKM